MVCMHDPGVGAGFLISLPNVQRKLDKSAKAFELLASLTATLRLHGMSWCVKTTCFKAPGVSLGGSGVSMGGVRSLRVVVFSKMYSTRWAGGPLPVLSRVITPLIGGYNTSYPFKKALYRSFISFHNDRRGPPCRRQICIPDNVQVADFQLVMK